ncbi:MAG: cell division protein FtsL [Buchnera aphidicola (Schlechtendalia peitan)]
MKNNVYNLQKIIFNDFKNYYKKLLILLLMITVSAISVITIVHKTRLLISQEEQLNILEKKMKIRWNNLILERNVLMSHNKIEQYAIKKLDMTYSDPLKENIILQ